MSDDVRVTLEQRLESGPLPVDEAVRIVWALCDRFEKQGKLETLGDVTPARVTAYGRVVEAVVPDALPVPGASAPERAMSGPTPRSDVYAMGALLVHLITGKPFDGSPLPESAAHLQPVLERCLQPDPQARFATLSELKRALVRMDKTLMSGGPKSTGEATLERTTLGPWNLEGLLGQGSMGHVYKARHQALGRLAAIKVLRPEQYQNPELIHRFFQEARTVNQINHEHIVEISDFVQEPGPKGPSIVYCVMEMLNGRTLNDELEQGPIPLARGLRIAEQLCDALAAAHRVGVVHRDVKPDNIMLIERGGSKDYVKVLDFGVAKLTDTDGKAMVSTTEGAIIGTPICMSPEQAQGDDVDARSDVWAVGVILYRLLTGRFPFDAPTFVNIAVQIITKPYAPLPQKTALGEPLPERLASLVEKCLQKRRDLRPASMDVVREELRAIASGEVGLEKAGGRRIPMPLVAAVVALLALGGGVVAWRTSTTKVDAPVVPPVVVAPVVPTVVPPLLPAVVVDAGAVAAIEVVDAGAGSQPEAVDAGTTAVVKKPAPRAVALSESVITKALTRMKRRLSGCAATYPEDVAKLAEAKARVSFETHRDGTLTAVKLDPPVEGSGLESCVAKVFADLPLPPNDGNPKFAKLRVPLAFGK